MVTLDFVDSRLKVPFWVFGRYLSEELGVYEKVFANWCRFNLCFCYFI